jgi:hypothetical protein
MAATVLLAAWGALLAVGGSEPGSSTPARSTIPFSGIASPVFSHSSVSRPVSPLVGTSTSTTASGGVYNYVVVTRAVSDCREYAAGDANWGCCRTHTYDLGKYMRIGTISGNTVAGPAEQKGRRYDWTVRVSSDGTTWTDLGTIAAYGARAMPFGPIAADCRARYIQICSGAQGYVDYSDLVIVLY